MLWLEFSESDQQALNYERYHHPHPRVQQRMEALWLKSQGVPHHQIARLCHISGNTLRGYLKRYQAGGVEALKQLSFHQEIGYRPRFPFGLHFRSPKNVVCPVFPHGDGFMGLTTTFSGGA